MAGDFNKPTVSSLYTAFPVEIRDMFADMAKGFDGASTTNYPTGAIRWSNANGRWEKYSGTVWNALISKYLIDVDTLDGYHAANTTGAIPISNGTVNTNLNADMVDGYNAGNSNGNVALANGTVVTNLNADLLDGYNSGNASGQIPISNGTRNVNLNADLLDGFEAAAFALLSGAVFTGDIVVYRNSTPTIGVVYLTQAQNRYLYADGAGYILANAGLTVGGSITASSHMQSGGNIHTANGAYYVYSYQNVYAQGDIIAYYSDERLKTRTGEIKNALSKVRALDGFHYKLNELGKTLTGRDDEGVALSAQQVQAVQPEVVTLAPFDIDQEHGGSKSGENYLTIKYDRLIPLLVEAIKELADDVDTLRITP